MYLYVLKIYVLRLYVINILTCNCTCHISFRLQARRQEFPEGGSSTRNASRAPRGRGSGGRSRPPEALGYLEQNPAN